METIAVAREATAMRRTTFSRPVALALDHGVIRDDVQVLDYGCGHGDDFRSLQAVGVDAVGWDPYYLADAEPRRSDVVHLGYVLNVIESPRERNEVLRRAFALGKNTLIVAVRVDRALKDAEAYGDGFVTKRKTFQKLYSQGEFRDYLQETLGVEPVMADLGIAYVFKSDAEKARYLANRTFGRRMEFQLDLHHRFRGHPLAQKIIARTTELGRLPELDEFAEWTTLAAEFGGVARVGRLVMAELDADAFLGTIRERAEDIVTYLAKLRFTGVRVPKMTLLPKEIQRDIRNTWKSLSRAKEEGLVLLFSMGQPDVVKTAMRQSPIGKHVGDALYVHASAADLLPPVIRMLEFAARRVVGQVDADVIKFSDHGRAVSFLRYPDFDTDPHPGLHSSVRVYLPRASYDIREYGDANPFILHRKELLVPEDYPLRHLFEGLTAAEEQAGLLDANDIGTRRGWQETLEDAGYRLDGHHLISADGSAPVRSAPRPDPTPQPEAAPAVSPPAVHEIPPVGPKPVVPYDDAVDPQDNQILDRFYEQLTAMKVHRSGGKPSLKKPLVILVVLSKIKQGQLAENKIRFPDIEPEIKKLLEEFTGKKPSGVDEPFDRLRTSPFWHIRLPDGTEAGPRVKIPRSSLRDPNCWAHLDDRVLAALRRSPDAPKKAAAIVTDKYLEGADAQRVLGRLGLD